MASEAADMVVSKKTKTEMNNKELAGRRKQRQTEQMDLTLSRPMDFGEILKSNVQNGVIST